MHPLMPSQLLLDLHHLKEINLLLKETIMDFSLLDFIFYIAFMSILVALLYRDAIIPAVKNWFKRK